MSFFTQHYVLILIKRPKLNAKSPGSLFILDLSVTLYIYHDNMAYWESTLVLKCIICEDPNNAQSGRWSFSTR